MKKSYKYLVAALLPTTGLSCKKSFLDESPLDFLGTANAFKTQDDFNASVNNLYGMVRNHFYTAGEGVFVFNFRTDNCFDTRSNTPNLANDINPSGSTATYFWAPNYKVVSEANTIISRLAGSSLTDSLKTLFEAKARFFRAFGYRNLAYVYGGVPLVLEEVTAPKTDYVRASRHEVYARIIEDLKFAATNLPAIAQVKDGEVSVQAAQHLLAEVYNADGQYQNAVDAATALINHPNMALMTSRFGRRQAITPGDVYWDLFQKGNQNRASASANKEAIWVMQIEETTVGGGGAVPAPSNFVGVFPLERDHVPQLNLFTLSEGGKDVAPFIWPVGDYTGGRGVGYLAPSVYYKDSIWASDFNNDIRNANHNFVRKFKANNPKSASFGQILSADAPPAGSKGNGVLLSTKNAQPYRYFHPYQSKATQVFDHPAALYALNISDFTTPAVTAAEYNALPDTVKKFHLSPLAGATYIDQYMFRLAETYLLRAEAYLGLGNTSSAAADINMVRARSNATPISPGNVTLDYILDERLREFGVEEKRLLTLMRLGKLADRVRKCNPYYAAQMLDKYNLFPLPASEIERNNTAKLEQNPGY